MTSVRRSSGRRHGLLFGASLVGVAFTTVALAQPGVRPAAVDVALDPGQNTLVVKTVETPVQSPAPLDVYFLADTTGSMGPAIGNVRDGAGEIITAIDAVRPDTAYGAGDYKDFQLAQVDPYAFLNCAGITNDGGTAARACIDGWSADGGEDGPESQLHALHRIATGEGDVDYRSGSTKVVAWFGDAPAHDPVCGSLSGDAHGDLTEASVTADLVAAGIRVVAVSTTTGIYPAGLDEDPFGGDDYGPGCPQTGTPGLATRIAAATGGSALIGVPPGEVADAILGLITTLQVNVTPSVTCSHAGIAVTFDPLSRAVSPGGTGTFDETIAVATGTPAGTYTCIAKFLIDGADAGPAFTQTITVTVPPVIVPSDRVLLLIDEDSIDNGNQPNRFSASAVNDKIAKLGLRTPLPAFDGDNIGLSYILYTGDVGDEGLFAPRSNDPRWAATGPTADAKRNFVGHARGSHPHGVGPGLGSHHAKGGDREARLDKVPDVVPLRATGLAGLVGKSVCAVVWDGDIGLNYGPITASLKGANLGTVAFKVLSSSPRTNGSSGSLPAVRVEVEDAGMACDEQLTNYEAPEPRSSSEPFDTGR